MKKIIIAIILAGALGAIAYGISQRSTATKSASEIATATVTKGMIRTAVACTGRVVPNLDVQIKCKASGEIIKLPFDVSDHVKQGDLLLQIDPVDEERMVRQSEASLAASMARLQTAKTNLAVAKRDLVTEQMRAGATLKSAEANAKDAVAKAERMKELLAKKLTSPEETETASTNASRQQVEFELAKIRLEELKTKEVALDLREQDVKLNESEVESDKLTLEIQKKRFRDTSVFAPMAGVVATRDVQIGQIISSGVSNVGGGTTTMILSDLSRVFVLASVDESYIGQVKVGQAADVTADAHRGQIFEGKVVRIATQGVSTNNVVTFEVKIEIVGKNKALLKPEMTTNVQIIISQHDDVLLVPVECVIRKNREYTATIVTGEAKEARVVRVGLNDLTNMEIVSGLTEGDTILVHKEGNEGQFSGRGNRQQQSGPAASPFMGPPGGGRRH